MDMTTCPDASVFDQGRMACCLVVALLHVCSVVSLHNFPNSGICLIETRFHFTTKAGCGFKTLEIVIRTDARLYAEICIRINRAKLVQQRHIFFNRASLCAMKIPLMRLGKMSTWLITRQLAPKGIAGQRRQDCCYPAGTRTKITGFCFPEYHWEALSHVLMP
jgi:hypothetical protein